MGRKKKNPDQEGPPTASVRIDVNLAKRARLVVEDKGVDLSEYLDGIIKETVLKDYARWKQSLDARIADANAKNPHWRDLAGNVAGDPERLANLNRMEEASKLIHHWVGSDWPPIDDIEFHEFKRFVQELQRDCKMLINERKAEEIE